MPEDGYNGKDIIEIGKDLANKHPEIKDYSDEERLKTFRQLGVDYEMDKLKRDLADFNVHFDNWFSETSLYENGAIDNTLAKMKELRLHMKLMVQHGYVQVISKMIKTVY